MRRGTGSILRLRRAMVVLASAGANTVPAIARLVQADEDLSAVSFTASTSGMPSLDPRWAGGRPRQISPDDEQFIVSTANTRPTALGQPSTCWSVRKLADYLTRNPERTVLVGAAVGGCPEPPELVSWSRRASACRPVDDAVGGG